MTSAVASVVAFCVVGLFLYYLFERDIKERVHAEMHHHLTQLLAGLEVDQSGRLHLTRAMADPRFLQPLSGLYWEVDGRGEQVLVSRSLWDASLKQFTPEWENLEEPVVIAGPFDEPILIHSRIVTIGEGSVRQQLRASIAINETEVLQPSRRFALRLGLSLLVLALAFILVSAIQLAMFMSPLSRLRNSIRDIRDGRDNRVSGRYPVEIMPIVGKLNSLLVQKEKTIESARARASNFAHGLKTPLTIIETLVSSLRESSLVDVAAGLSGQSDQIRKLVDRELVRARMASGYGEPLRNVEAVVQEIVATIRQLPRGRDITFDIDVPAGQSIQMDRDDFIELVGNILDNARKWAKSRVTILFEKFGCELRLTITDDGPGISSEEMAVIIERGRRLDEGVEGTGIGLAIVSDIVNAYRLKMSLSKGDVAGLQVAITFPKYSGRREAE